MPSYKVFYEMNDGNIKTDRDIKEAFYIQTGKYADTSDEYVKWLNERFDKGIIKKYFRPNVKVCLDAHREVLATFVYKEQHDCSLLEARKRINKIIETMYPDWYN